MKTTDKIPPGFRFSTGLVEKVIAYFRKNYEVTMTEEEADLFLDSLATITEILTKPTKAEIENVQSSISQ